MAHISNGADSSINLGMGKTSKEGNLVTKKGPGKPTWRQLAWLASLTILAGLVVGAWKPMRDAVQQAEGMRTLLLSGEEISKQDLKNPFVCLRDTGDVNMNQASLEKIGDVYLRSVGLCMAGKREEGISQLKQAGGHANADVQYAAAISQFDQDQGLDIFEAANLDQKQKEAALVDLVSIEGIDSKPILRELVHLAGDQQSTWSLWLNEWWRLVEANEWETARAWLEEGQTLIPEKYRSSLFLRIGRTYQMYAEVNNYERSIKNYDEAIKLDQWLYSEDEASAHLYRGEVYRILSENYTTEQVINEFKIALMNRPGSFWALLDLGHVYLYDLQDITNAEEFYRQALTKNPESPYAYFYLGEVFRSKGDNLAAIDWYRQALVKLPGWQPAVEKINSLEGK